MQSNNPVFRKSEEFNSQNPYSQNPYGQNSYGQNPYGQNTSGNSAYPASPYDNYGQAPVDPSGRRTYAPAPTGARMTIDSVVQKTGITVGLTILTAVVTWLMTPAIEDTDAVGQIFAVAMLGSGAAFILSLVNSFKKMISPALVLAFAVAEGVALGALSKAIETFVAADSGNGVVMQAVIGTFFAFAGTLASYKFFDIKVTPKFQRFVIAAMFGMVGLGLLELVLGLFGNSFGLFGFGALGLVTAVIGLVLGVFMLILDFDFVEQGIANGLPEHESWRAAFGMTVSLVWIYTNLLRLLAIFQDN